MRTIERSAAPPALGAIAIWSVMMVLSFLTAIVERSPIHSDSWGPLLSVWAAGALVGIALLVLRKPAWAAAWLIATVGAIVGFVGAVFLIVLVYGS